MAIQAVDGGQDKAVSFQEAQTKLAASGAALNAANSTLANAQNANDKKRIAQAKLQVSQAKVDYAIASTQYDIAKPAASPVTAAPVSQAAATVTATPSAKADTSKADAAAAVAAANKATAEAQAKLDAAMKDAQSKKDAETAAALAAANEEVRLAKEEAAKLAAEKAASDAANAKTAQELADANAAKIAAEAAIAAANAASAAAVAEANANINKSGDVAIPESSLTDTAAAMYAKELAIKEAEDAALAKRQSIMEVVTDRFNSYNLGTLASKIRELAIGGANEATITLALQQTDEYKERFKANALRAEKKLRVLQPSEYLAAEESYRQVLRTYGLNQFDTPEQVSQFIANDTSSTEINNRISTAVTRIKNADPAIISTLRDYYNLGNTDLIAYVLDTKNQLPEVLKKVSAAEIGTAATKQGLTSTAYGAELLANQGVDQAQAQAVYSKIAEVLPTAEKLSDIYGTTMEGYDQKKAEQEYFGQMASAKRARESLRAREIASFSGSAGLTKGSLAQKAQGLIQNPISIDQPEIAYKTGSKSQPIPPNGI